jgi:hypothetical protein
VILGIDQVDRAHVRAHLASDQLDRLFQDLREGVRPLDDEAHGVCDVHSRWMVNDRWRGRKELVHRAVRHQRRRSCTDLRLGLRGPMRRARFRPDGHDKSATRPVMHSATASRSNFMSRTPPRVAERIRGAHGTRSFARRAACFLDEGLLPPTPMETKAERARGAHNENRRSRGQDFSHPDASLSDDSDLARCLRRGARRHVRRRSNPLSKFVFCSGLRAVRRALHGCKYQ